MLLVIQQKCKIILSYTFSIKYFNMSCEFYRQSAVQHAARFPERKQIRDPPPLIMYLQIWSVVTDCLESNQTHVTPIAMMKFLKFPTVKVYNSMSWKTADLEKKWKKNKMKGSWKEAETRWRCILNSFQIPFQWLLRSEGISFFGKAWDRHNPHLQGRVVFY